MPWKEYHMWMSARGSLPARQTRSRFGSLRFFTGTECPPDGRHSPRSPVSMGAPALLSEDGLR
jgi:hypothetical protein